MVKKNWFGNISLKTCPDKGGLILEIFSHRFISPKKDAKLSPSALFLSMIWHLFGRFEP